MNDTSRRSLVCSRQTSYFTLNCGERSKHLEDISQFNDEFQTFNQIIHDNQTVNKPLIVNCIYKLLLLLPLQEQYLKNETIEINTLIENATTCIYQIFSPTCRRYTDVMVHKHELQSLIFSMDDNPSSLNVTANIAPLMVQLESAAFRLKNFMVCLLSTIVTS